MKILIIQENGRHNENRVFRECFNFQRAFNRLGHNAVVWGLGHDNFTEPIERFIDECDFIFILENYPVGNWLPNLNNINKLKVFWSIDSHCNIGAHIATTVHHKVDILLNAIESDQNKFGSIKSYYFPVAYPSDLIFPFEGAQKNIFIGFCGTNFDDRIQYIDRLNSKFNLSIPKDIWWLGNSMVEKINSYRIHFNKTVGNDINYRVFETMGCNTMLLTNDTENITTFFKDMENIVIYKNEDELHEKVDFLINNQEEIEKISQKGYEEVLKKHTFDNRAKELIDIVEKHI
jgi:hypothetical protein